jgi:hypothetical protein
LVFDKDKDLSKDGGILQLLAAEQVKELLQIYDFCKKSRSPKAARHALVL